MTADWAIFGAMERDALIAALPEAAERTASERAIIDHPGVVTLYEEAYRTQYTTRQAIDAWRTAFGHLDGLRTVCQVAYTTTQVAHQLSVVLADAIAAGSAATVIWADTWGRARVEIAVPSVRHRFAVDLLRSPNEAMRLSPGGDVVVAVSLERWTDDELLALVQRTSETGATLQVLVCLDDPFATRPNGMWRLLAERIRGAPLPPGRMQAESLDRLANLLTGPSMGGRPFGPGTNAGRVARCVSRGEEAITGAHLSPRDAWRADNGPLDLLIHDTSDWAWADPLLVAKGVLARPVFSDATNALFLAVAARSRVVVDRMASLISDRRPGLSAASPSQDHEIAPPDRTDLQRDDAVATASGPDEGDAVIALSEALMDVAKRELEVMAGAASAAAELEAKSEAEVGDEFGTIGRAARGSGGVEQESAGERVDGEGGRRAASGGAGGAGGAGHADDSGDARLSGRGSSRADTRRPSRGPGGAAPDTNRDRRAPSADRGSPFPTAALIPLRYATPDPRLVPIASRARELAEAGRRDKLTMRLRDHLRAIEKMIVAAEAREESDRGGSGAPSRVTVPTDAGVSQAGAKTERDSNSLDKERIAVEMAIEIVAEETGWSEQNLAALLQLSAERAAIRRIKRYSI